jgi:branched-chain amino acid transport system ATP-binding protein
MTDPLLKLENVTKRFGLLNAIDDVSFRLESSGTTALIGPNGAGKTTTYNIITGLYQPTDGRVHFKGEDITGDSTVERARKGIGRSFQITNIFEGLTAYENVRIPVITRSRQRWNPVSRIQNDAEIRTETTRILELVGLEDITDTACDELSYGDKRRVEIAVTMATDPSLALLDEPTAGMNPTEIGEMVELLRDLEDQTDISFFITEHDMDVIFSIADRILVLHNGALIGDGTPEEIQQNKQIRAAYLGEHA